MKQRKRLLISAIASTVLAIGAVGCSKAPEPQQGGSGQAGGAQPAVEVKKSDYPQKDIELVVAYAAGGGTDAIARFVAHAAGKYMPNGKNIVVSNKPGAGGTIALAEVMQAKPDGYKLGSVTTGNLAIAPNYGKTPFKSDSFIPIAQFSAVPNMLVVQTDAPWKTYDEWLNWVKKNPGKFPYGTGGAGGTQHLAMEGLNELESVQTKHVPFEGAAPALTALLGGHVQGAIVNVNEAKPHVDAGKLRVLVNLGTSKVEAYKDAMFLKDKGFVGLDSWSGVVVPKDTPKEVVDTLRDVFNKAMKDPSIKDEFNKLGVEPAYTDGEQFANVVADSNKLSGELVKKLGMAN